MRSIAACSAAVSLGAAAFAQSPRAPVSTRSAPFAASEPLARLARPELRNLGRKAPEVAQWTFLIYAAIDNDAERDGNFFAFFDGVRRAYDDDPGIEIVLFVDRSAKYSTNATSLGEDFADTRLYRVRSGKCERLAGGAEFPEITLDGTYESDSADPVNVRKFLAYAKAHHPAKHYALMLYGHADGRAMCPDEQTGTEMGFAQLTDMVPAEASVDLMALELCTMGAVEIAYQWRPGNGGFSTKYLVAIPNAGPPLDWSRVFDRLRTEGPPTSVDPAALTPAAFGALIVDEGGAGRRAAAEREPQRAERLAHEAVACYDLAEAAKAKAAVDAFAVELARGGAAAKDALLALRGPGEHGCTLNYVGDRIDRVPFVDLFDLATRAAGSMHLDEATRAAAQAVAEATDALVHASYGGKSLPRFVPGATGVFVTLPSDTLADTRDGKKPLWDLCRWYSPHRVPGVYGNLAWCRDGAVAGDGKVQNWFELLDCWFGGEGKGANGYAY